MECLLSIVLQIQLLTKVPPLGCLAFFACIAFFGVTKTSIIMKFITSFHTLLTWEVGIAYDKSTISIDRLNKRPKYWSLTLFSRFPFDLAYPKLLRVS